MRRHLKRGSRRVLELQQRHFVFITSVLALVFVAGVAFASDRVLRDQIGSESRRHATTTAKLLAQSSYAPALIAAERSGARGQADLRNELDAATRSAQQSGAIESAAIWLPDGRILYCDRAAFTGRRYPLPGDIRAALMGRAFVSHTVRTDTPTDLPGDHIDVTLPIRQSGNAQPIAVLDLDVPYRPVATDIRHRTTRFDRIVIVSGLVLYLLILPLLIRLGRDVRRQHHPGRARMIDELEDAIERGDLSLEFQPLIDLRTGTVKAIEALVRWDHPRRGRIPPDEFIPAVEDSAFFWEFTLHVLDLALAASADLRRQGIGPAVAVNVSSGDLLDPRLPGELRRLLAKHGVPAESIGLEVTEGALMEEIERAAQVLGEVAHVGIDHIAIDDFGTGYSSLARVHRLPIDAIKIDRSFIAAMDASGDSALVRSVIALAHNLGLTVVAEGIENEAVCRRLARLGCDLGQGWHISQPLGPDALADWLRARRNADSPGAIQDGERRRGPGRRRNDYFSVAFDNAPEAMMIADDAGRWVDANRAACRLLGVDREDIRYQRWGAFSPSKTRAELDAVWEELRSEGHVADGWTVNGAHGGAVTMEFEATAHFLPGLHLFVIRQDGSRDGVPSS